LAEVQGSFVRFVVLLREFFQLGRELLRLRLEETGFGHVERNPGLLVE